MIPNIKFEQFFVYESLIIVKDKSINKVIGYVHKNPLEKGWFWFHGETVSSFYNSIDDAMTGLIHKYMIHRMDNFSAKIPNAIIEK